MKININGVIREMTEEELAAAEKEERVVRVEESLRPMSVEEVSAMLITAQINTLAVDDKTALRMKSFYPTWAENTAYPVGHKVLFGGKLWKAVQAQRNPQRYSGRSYPLRWQHGAGNRQALFPELHHLSVQPGYCEPCVPCSV